MKAVIFAGGVGTRLWPLSRKKSPKQFERIIGDRSTLQIAVERLFPDFRPEDVYISTGEPYQGIVAEQLPMLPKKNILLEPIRRDVGPAVSVTMKLLAKMTPNEPVLIMWSDHLVKEVELFKKLVLTAGKHVIESKGEKIVFIGQTPRFASDNLGWIKTGKVTSKIDGIEFREFKGFKYKPDTDLAMKYFEDKSYCWNVAYFVSTPRFVTKLFHDFAPDIDSLTDKIINHKDGLQAGLHEYYREMPEINFDNAVLEKIDPKLATVLVEDIGWSDVGAWEALKEALERFKEDNIVKGSVLLEGGEDNLIYNYQDKLVVAIDLNNLLVINTDDVLMVANKSSVAKIKKVVENFKGTENEKLT